MIFAKRKTIPAPCQPLPPRSRRSFLGTSIDITGTSQELAGSPLVTVVLPIYNHASMVSESISSVLNQQSVQLELIIVDDGSTDNLDTVLEHFKSDPRVSIYKQSNQGISAALNKGFSHASGNFLSWTSADNRYLPGALFTLCRHLISNPNASLAYANIELINKNGALYPDHSYRPQNTFSEKPSTLLLPLEGELLGQDNDNFIGACFMYRREAIDLIGGYNPKLQGIEDYDYWLRLRRIGPPEHVGTDEPLYQYRLHSQSITGKLESSKLAEQTQLLAESFRESKPELILDNLKVCALGFANPPKWEDLTRFTLSARTQDANLNVTCIASDLPLRVKTHANFIDTKLNYTSLIWKALPEAPQGALSLPSLKVPELIRRARSSNYQALQAAAGTTNSLLLFTPDSEEPHFINSVKLMLRELPLSTIVLLCANQQQRNVANLVASELEDIHRLRVVDISDQTLTGDKFGTAAINALTYVLSSIDAVVNPCKLSTLAALCEFRLEAAIAATAGVPLLWLQQQAPTSNSSSIGDLLEQANSGLGISDLWSRFPFPPHAKSIRITQVHKDYGALLESDLSKALCHMPEPATFCQWLETTKKEWFYQQIRQVAVAKCENARY
jgi:glycosyltransferase involved in cell wall biosynthesis